MIGEVVAVNDSEIYVKEKGVRRIFCCCRRNGETISMC